MPGKSFIFCAPSDAELKQLLAALAHAKAAPAPSSATASLSTKLSTKGDALGDIAKAHTRLEAIEAAVCDEHAFLQEELLRLREAGAEGSAEWAAVHELLDRLTPIMRVHHLKPHRAA